MQTNVYRKSYDRDDYNHKIGDAGEKIVADILQGFSDKYRGVWVWNNKYILSAQIDHMILIRHGMFFRLYVIETKNWSGSVSGKAWEKDWSVMCYGKIRYYGNPIKQNRKHCRVVRMLFPLLSIKNVVVFVSADKFPKVEYWQCNAYVVDCEGLKELIGVC